MALVTFFKTETGFDWTQVEDYVEVDVKESSFSFSFFVISNQKNISQRALVRRPTRYLLIT